MLQCLSCSNSEGKVWVGKTDASEVSYWSFMICLHFFLGEQELKIYCKRAGHTVDCSTSQVVSSDGRWARKWAPTSDGAGTLLVHIDFLAYRWMDRAYLFRACSILFMFYSVCGSIFCAYAALFLFGLPLASSSLWEIIYIYNVCLLALPKCLSNFASEGEDTA